MSQEVSFPLNKDSENDLAFVIRLTCLAIFITLCMEWQIFLPGFRHPFLTLIPLYEPLSTLPPLIDRLLFVLCIMLLIWLFITPRNRFLSFGISVCILFWGMQDIVRFQPWFHMYCFVTLAAAFAKTPSSALSSLRIMICGVYFWAGFHKLNLTFFTKIMPWFLSPIYLPSLDWLFKAAIFITPFFEAAIGILLLFHKWRIVATCMALGMLIMIFACIGPFGHHWGKVIPLWNIWLFSMELRLFLNPSYQENVSLFPFKLKPMNTLSIVMFIIAPALAIFFPAYARLGFKVFSGNTLTAEIILSPQETLSYHRGLFKGIVKQNNKLSFKIPIYHSEYAYQKRSQAISPYLKYPSQARLRIYSPPPFYTTERKEYTDLQLEE